jgi:hypothetical protein
MTKEILTMNLLLHFTLPEILDMNFFFMLYVEMMTTIFPIN